jgi:hypothetical protein
MAKTKNKITTLSYFLKRLRDNHFIALKIWNDYAISDPRKWTILIDPGGTSLFITCYENKNFKGERIFELNDGGKLFPRNYFLSTLSMEVIVMELIKRAVPQYNLQHIDDAQKSVYLKEKE